MAHIVDLKVKRIEIVKNEEATNALAQANIAKVKRTKKKYQLDLNLSPKTLRSTKNSK